MNKVNFWRTITNQFKPDFNEKEFEIFKEYCFLKFLRHSQKNVVQYSSDLVLIAREVKFYVENRKSLSL